MINVNVFKAFNFRFEYNEKYKVRWNDFKFIQVVFCLVYLIVHDLKRNTGVKYCLIYVNSTFIDNILTKHTFFIQFSRTVQYTMQQNSSTIVRHYRITAVQQCSSAEVQQCSSAVIQQCSSSVLQQCSSAAVQQCSSAAVQKCSSAAVQYCSGAAVQQCSSAAVQ